MKQTSKTDKVHTFEIAVDELIAAIVSSQTDNAEDGMSDASNVADLIAVRDELNDLINDIQTIEKGEDSVAINKAFSDSGYFRVVSDEDVAEEAIKNELEIVLEIVYGNNKRVTITNNNITF